MTIIYHSDVDKIRELLLGRRVVSAVEGDAVLYYSSEPAAVLTLDNGTVLNVIPNQGGCSCSAGDYHLTSLSTVDNIITDVQVVIEDEVDSDAAWSNGTTYTISVFAGMDQINLVRIDGDDGNGYYGTGFAVTVQVPEMQS